MTISNFFHAWLSKPAADRRRNGAGDKESLAHIDRYDRQDVDRISKEIRDFRVAHDKLCDVVPTGSHLFRDATQAFFKDNDALRPQEDMNVHYLLNHKVMTEIAKLPERDRLRTWTVGDIVGAALAAVDIEPELESFYDRAKTEASDAERLADQLSMLMAQINLDETEIEELEELLRQLADVQPLDLSGLTPPDPGDLEPEPEDQDGGCEDKGDEGELAGGTPGDDGTPVAEEGEEGDAAGATGDGEASQDPQEGGEEAGGSGGPDDAEEDEDDAEGEGDGPGTGKETGQEQGAQGSDSGSGSTPASGGGVPSPGEEAEEKLDKAKDSLDRHMAQAEEVAEQLVKAIEQAARRAMPIIRQGISQAADNAEQASLSAQAWGVEPGALQRMPAAERLKLAERIRSVRNFEAMTDMIGKLDRLASAEKMKVTYHSFEEIFDIDVGDDLARVLPSEMVSLTQPVLKLDFYRKYQDKQLLQYEMRGQEKLGKGGIIFAMDNSGSMAGQPEVLAKGTGIATLHIAKEQKRSFYGIHFSSVNEIECFDFRDPKDQDVYRVLDFAEHFYGHNTDFHTPLVKALEILHEENETAGLTRSDILFVTDGMAPLDAAFLKHFIDELDRLEATCYGIAIGCPKTSKPLADFCNGGVCEIRDLLSGEDLRTIFTGLGST